MYIFLAMKLVGFDDCQFELNIHCSKGTYVRTIAEEIGKALHVGAHVTALRRVSAGPFDEDDLVSLDRLETERENGSLDKFFNAYCQCGRPVAKGETDGCDLVLLETRSAGSSPPCPQ